jgi:hypothetical protein
MKRALSGSVSGRGAVCSWGGSSKVCAGTKVVGKDFETPRHLKAAVEK